jgi:hypothetical protein
MPDCHPDLPADHCHTGNTGTPGSVCARGGIGCDLTHDNAGPFSGVGEYGAWSRDPHRRTLRAAEAVQAAVEAV